MSAHPDDTLVAADLEVHPSEGLALAGGEALPMSVREFSLLVALLRRQGGIVARADLYRQVWGGTLRPGDRSIDVYVHKVRTKLEQALPDWRFIHTHVGFGYRLHPEPVGSPSFHNLGTSRQQAAEPRP